MSLSPISGSANALANRLNTRLRWVYWMPFGMPVVPEVYMMVARSSILTALERASINSRGTPAARLSTSCKLIARWPVSRGFMTTMCRRSGREDRLFSTFSSCSLPETMIVPIFACFRM